MARRVVALVVMIAFGSLAHLPAAQAQLPRVELPTTVNDALGGVRDATGNVRDAGNVAGRAERLADVRRLRINELVRVQRAAVERDPAGQPILRAEIVSFNPSDAALERAREAGFEIARERSLEALEARVVVLRAPNGLSIRRALNRLRELDPEGSYDYNHVYLDSGVVASAAPAPGVNSASFVTLAAAEPGAVSPGATTGPSHKVGLIDSGVDVTHPVFKTSVIHQHGCDGRSVPATHGTAVASLLVGKSDPFNGAAPGAELYAADVYCGLGTGGAVDAVAAAFAWLASQHVPVINVSLVGPRNVLLENVVKLVVARGHVVVAAVGNDGPAAAPLYPASYPDVIGVTAVDARRKVLLEACRGKQVDFSAPGADMAAANLSPTFTAVRGTSFAAPLVAGLLAASVHEPSRAEAARAVESLGGLAVDLGSRGVDKTYGAGLVGDALRAQAPLALAHANASAPGSK
jgi:subtilisin family serine protease